MKTTFSTNAKLTSIKAKDHLELQNYLIPFAYNQSTYKQKKITFISTDISCNDFLKQFSLLEGRKIKNTDLEKETIDDKQQMALYSLDVWPSDIGNSILLDFPDKSLLRNKKQELDISLLKNIIPFLKEEYRTAILIIENIDALISKAAADFHHTKESLLHTLHFLSRKHNIHIVFGDPVQTLNDYEEEIIDAILFPDNYGYPTVSGNLKFVFTPKKTAKLQELNDKIRLEEIRMKNFYLKNERLFDKWIKKELIDDYNMYDTRLSLWSNDEEFNKKHRIELGNPFFESILAISTGGFDDKDFFNTNWNEFNWNKDGIHPLKSMYMCYTIHCIVFHSHVAWEDLLNVDDVWMEFNIDFQFFTDKD